MRYRIDASTRTHYLPLHSDSECHLHFLHHVKGSPLARREKPGCSPIQNEDDLGPRSCPRYEDELRRRLYTHTKNGTTTAKQTEGEGTKDIETISFPHSPLQAAVETVFVYTPPTV